MKQHLFKTSEGLRYGYSTGSCAAAATRGALMMLRQQGKVDEVCLDTPAGIKLTLPLTDQKWGLDWASCSVIKDSGDDPDITRGIKIFAKVIYKNSPGYELEAGDGIGRVTKPGLQIPPGEAAINPVPRKMIADQVQELIPAQQGVVVTVSAPEGKALAERTFNPRLGIVGGISILGTTGLVEPKSVDAFRTSLVLALDIAAAENYTGELVLVPGALGERFAREQLGLPAETIVQMGNFVGFMLREAAKRGFKKLTLVGHIGKLVKVAAGIFDTSSRVADARLETIADYAAQEEADPALVKRVLALSTAEASVALLEEHGLLRVFDRIAQAVSQQACSHVVNKTAVDCVIYSFGKGIIGRSVSK